VLPAALPRRLLVSWLVVTGIGVPLGAITGLYPPGRLLTFAFCVPLLAALGAGWLATRPRWLPRAAAGAGVALLLWAGVHAWTSARVFVEDDVVRDLAGVVRATADDPPGTPIVFVVDRAETPALFLATFTENLVRAAMPPERAADVAVFIGSVDDLLASGPGATGSAIGSPSQGPPAQAYSERARRALAESPDAVVVAMPSVYDGPADDPRLTAFDPDASPPPGVAPSSPGPITAATAATFVLLTAIGLGWSRWAAGDLVLAAAIAPAAGTATLAVAGLVLERIGVPMDGAAGPVAASAIACVTGLALAWKGRTSDVRAQVPVRG
jgi:hypothetical protein